MGEGGVRHAESNPPSVRGSIHLCGLPLLHTGFISSICPYIPWNGRFTVFFLMSIRLRFMFNHQGNVSFLLQCPASQQMPYGITVLYDGWSFLSLNYT